MRDNKLHTPVGLRDFLPEECAVKKEILKRIEEVFKCYGYNAVESPMFEYIEVFSDEKRGSTNPKQMYKFFDRDGSTLALRSDMTPPIARIAATAYADVTGPLRFYYTGNAFRDNANYQGKLREFSQAGIELMGVNSVEADAEALAVAVKSLLSTGLTKFKINVGQVKFFKAILDETGLNEKTCKELQDLIGRRNYVGVEALAEKSAMTDNIKKLFVEMPRLVGKVEVLSYAKKLTNSKDALDALDELERLFEILKLYGIDDYIMFDLGMVNKLNYYTGIIFRGYTYGTGYSVVDGGRYDNLVEQYGVQKPSVGFGVRISEVISALENQKINVPYETAKTLIACCEKGRAASFQTAETLRISGMYVESSIIGNDIEVNTMYAKERGMSHLLYFIDDVNLKVISLADEMGGFTVDVTIDELLNPKGGKIKWDIWLLHLLKED